jgi:hypothetical protein
MSWDFSKDAELSLCCLSPNEIREELSMGLRPTHRDETRREFRGSQQSLPYFEEYIGRDDARRLASQPRYNYLLWSGGPGPAQV